MLVSKWPGGFSLYPIEIGKEATIHELENGNCQILMFPETILESTRLCMLCSGLQDGYPAA